MEKYLKTNKCSQKLNFFIDTLITFKMTMNYKTRAKQIKQLLNELEEDKKILCTQQGEFILSLINDKDAKEEMYKKIHTIDKFHGDFKEIIESISHTFPENEKKSIKTHSDYLLGLQYYINKYLSKLKEELDYIKNSEGRKFIKEFNNGKSISNLTQYFSNWQWKTQMFINQYQNIVDTFGNKRKDAYMRVLKKIFEC